jgi:Chaperone of endosialidase
MDLLGFKRRALGYHASCADAPDMSGVNTAAQANAEIGKETLAFYKQVYAEQAPERAKAAAINDKVANAQLASMEQNTAISKDYYDYQTGTFRPMEKSIVADAENYDTQERRNEKAAQAVADVGIQSEVARKANVRQMQRMGVNPNSGKMLALGNQMALGEVMAKAGAANKAREAVETQGFARKMDAASLGRGLASNQATSAGVALNAGNSSTQNAAMTMQQANQAAATMGQGFSQATAANNSSGQLYATAAQAAGQDNGVMGAVGAVAGGWAGSASGSKTISDWISDENKKTNIKPKTDQEALEAVEKTPVSEWTYKDGEGDGGTHIGPMAQDVQKNMGDGVAPDGKRIDPITMNGVTMASVAALSRKVDKLSKQIKEAKA